MQEEAVHAAGCRQSRSPSPPPPLLSVCATISIILGSFKCGSIRELCSCSGMATVLQSFLRCGRNGKITKVVREHYLRDDIFCGLDGCAICTGKIHSNTPTLVLFPTSVAGSDARITRERSIVKGTPPTPPSLLSPSLLSPSLLSPYRSAPLTPRALSP